MRSSRRNAGVTLLELLVGMSIMLIVTGMAMVSFVTQSQSLRVADMGREANASVRDAMVPIEGAARDLGWGLDPRFAIDLTTATRSVDRFNATDELAFFARDASYRWQDVGEGACTTVGGCFAGNAFAISSANVGSSPRTVTITLPSGTVLQKGRVLLAMCAQALNPVMFTLSSTVTGSGSATTLTPAATNAAPYNDWSSLQACHGASGASLFLVNRYHFYVSTSNPPWLMLDTGLDLNGNGTLPPTDPDDVIPVAKNVEDFQVAYILRSSAAFTAPDSNTDWIVGNNRASAAIEELDPTLSAPVYATTSASPLRYNKHPANVEELRVTLTFRSDKTDKTRRGWAGDSLPGAENRAGSLSGGQYRRYTNTTQIRLFNMGSKSNFIY